MDINDFFKQRDQKRIQNRSVWGGRYRVRRIEGKKFKKIGSTIEDENLAKVFLIIESESGKYSYKISILGLDDFSIETGISNEFDDIKKYFNNILIQILAYIWEKTIGNPNIISQSNGNIIVYWSFIKFKILGSFFDLSFSVSDRLIDSMLTDSINPFAIDFLGYPHLEVTMQRITQRDKNNLYYTLVNSISR